MRDYLTRQRNTVDLRNGAHIYFKGKKYINFSSNDYLSLSNHEKLKNSFTFAIEKYGLGSGSSPLITGYYDSHKQVEEEFAKWLGWDDAILFTSGYAANMAVVTTFNDKYTCLFLDKYSHASTIDGAKLSHGKFRRYSHQNIQQLERLLTTRKSSKALIATEGIFSMEGSITNLKDISLLAQKHNANLIIDDTHGIGILGKTGGGITEHFHLTQNEIPLLVISLGKAFSSMGAIVLGRKELIYELIQKARTYIYSTAISPAYAHSILATMKVIKNESWRRSRLKDNIQYFQQQSAKYKLNVTTTDESQIQALLIGDNEDSLKVQANLRDEGFWVTAIRPPTVPSGTARIRVSLNTMHTQQQIDSLCNCLHKTNKIIRNVH